MQSVQPPPARVLIVDDEPGIWRALMRALQLSGFEVATASSGDEALARLAAAPHDVMLLDLRMPGMQGEEVMQRARKHWPELLIIILTAHATLESAITAVRLGAVDYLLKPASVHEVIASVRRALEGQAGRRRRQAVETLCGPETRLPAVAAALALPEGVLRVNPLTLECQRRLLVVEVDGGSREVELSEGETLILGCLMAQPGQVLSSQQLARRAWQHEVDDVTAGGVVRPIIARLRSKMKELCPPGSQAIRNLRGRGYFLEV